MGFETIPGTSTTYGLIHFDKDGVERKEGAARFSDTLLERARTSSVTDVFMFCHGWKGDVPAAKEQYEKWMGAFMASDDRAKAATVFPGFTPLLIGIHWPSQPWGDEEIGGGAFAAGAGLAGEALIDAYVERLGDSPEIRKALETIVNEARVNAVPDELPANVREAYLELDAALGLGNGGVTAPPDADREGFDPDAAFDAANEESANFADFSLGGLLGPLRQLSYWTMKKRGRTIGEQGLHTFLNTLLDSTKDRGVRVHLMGHSFGTVVISSMLGGPGGMGTLVRPVNSVVLVQGAVSLWCYAPSIPFGGGGSGYFNRILGDGRVSGPLVTTQSKFDRAVGTLYPLASRLHGSASFGEFPEFGAIGTYGLQGLADTVRSESPMGAATHGYGFEKRRVYNLDGSQFIDEGGGASGAHSDIAGPEVAHVLWEAAFASA